MECTFLVLSFNPFHPLVDLLNDLVTPFVCWPDVIATTEAYQQTPEDNNGNGTSPRQRSSSTSSSSVTSDSPHVRKRSSKKKFIKNMRPDGFRRPSSYYCSDAEAAGVSSSSKSPATLIGYRKVPIPDNIPGGGVRLGTFSPTSDGSGSPGGMFDTFSFVVILIYNRVYSHTITEFSL